MSSKTIFDMGQSAGEFERATEWDLVPDFKPPKKRTIVTLCGSTRFLEAFQQANLRETMAGKIVLSIGCDTKSDDNLFAAMSEADQERTKSDLDALHLDKIAMSDEVLVLNVGGYVGSSTRREVQFAIREGKKIRWLDEGNIPADLRPTSLQRRMF